MRTIENDSKIMMPDSRSTKRLHDYDRSRFSPFPEVGRKPFDDRVRDVLFEYAWDNESISQEIAYLDSIGFGCARVPGALETQINYFAHGPSDGEVHAPPFTWNKNYQQAVRQVIKLLKPRFHPLSVLEFKSERDCLDALPKEDSHAGFMYLETGKKLKGEYAGELFNVYKEAETVALEKGSLSRPILAAWRLQCSGAYEDGSRTGSCKQKERLVSIYDLASVMLELVFSKAAQSHLGSSWIYSGSKPDWQIGAKLSEYRQKYSFWLSIDMSRFDQSLPAWLIRDAFEVVWSWFESADLDPKYRKLFEVVVRDFIHKNFVGPGGSIIHADNGVPSGSMFTQIIDTICNLIMLYTYNNHLLQSLTLDCMICGDDNIIFTWHEIDRDDLAGYYKRNFGVVINAEKCDWGRTEASPPSFLSREWRYEGAWRDPKELIAKLLYPERFRDYFKNKQLDPKLIIYSYILAYPVAMDELMYVTKFKIDNPGLHEQWTDAMLDYMSGWYAYETRQRSKSRAKKVYCT